MTKDTPPPLPPAAADPLTKLSDLIWMMRPRGRSPNPCALMCEASLGDEECEAIADDVTWEPDQQWDAVPGAAAD